jgi:tetratricopeptide (TPR) repeat protein
MTGDLEGAALELESYASTTRDPSRADQARASAEQLHQEAAYIREGRRLAREDEIDDALAQLYNVLRIDQSSSVAYFEIGRVRYQDHDFKQAVESLKYARQLNWNHADTHYLLADAYEHIGMPAEALEEYKVYLQLAPSGSLVDLARERVGALDRMLSRSPGHEPVSPASHGTPP